MKTLEGDLTNLAAQTADRIERVAAAIRAHNIEVIVVDTGVQARSAALDLIPDGAEVHSGKSKTLEDLGLLADLIESGRYDPIRPRLSRMDRQTQGTEMRKLSSAPNYMLGSVAAVTEDGALVAASGTGSQLAAYAAGAGHLILIVGSQKIVADLDEGLRRIQEHVLPYEDARLQAQLGVPTKLARLLVMYEEPRLGRVTVVLVREPVGV